MLARITRQGVTTPARTRFERSLLLSTAIALLAAGNAAAAQTAPSGATTDAAPANAAANGEILVTAQKRSERLQDVPIAITAIGNTQLDQAHVNGTAGLTQLVPSLSIKTLVPGENQIVMRGINTGYGLAPAVSYYLDETPFDFRSDGFSGAPDVDFFDVARVEALRGPQGTIYGASSMGGTIRVITNAPSNAGFDYKTELSSEAPIGGKGLGYDAKLVLNVPLAPDLAGRIFVSDAHTAGFSTRVTPVNGYYNISASDPIGKSDDNTSDLTSVRAALRWTPNDWVITPTVSYQNNIANGYPYSDANRPRYEYSNLFTSRNWEQNIVANLKIEKPLGDLKLISSTSYLNKIAHNTQDYSGTGERYYRGLGLDPADEVVPMTSYLPKTYRSVVQEVRISKDTPGLLNWVAGVFFEHTKIDEQQYITSPTYVQAASPGYPGDVEFYDIIPWTDKQYAAFVDGTLNLGKVKVSAGGRVFHYEQIYTYSEGGLDGDPVDNNVTDISSAKTGFNPRFNIDYKPDPNVTLYTTASKGFRIGGVNPSLVASAGSTCTYQSVFERGFAPDSLWNYEIGAKTQTADHRVTFNADGYRIDWSNIQQAVNSTCGSFVGNFGSARIYGLEGEFHWKIVPGWNLNANADYTNAKFHSFNAGYAGSFNIAIGQRLINTPRVQASVGTDYNLDLGNDKGARFRVDVQYTGSTPTSYSYTDPTYTINAYTNVNLSIAGHIGKTEVEVFVRNLTNAFEQLGASPGRSRNYAEYMVAPPETIGVTIRHTL